jgi:hypothetical protein
MKQAGALYYLNEHLEEIALDKYDVPTLAHFLCLMASKPAELERFIYYFIDQIKEISGDDYITLYATKSLLYIIHTTTLDPKLEKLLSMWGFDEDALDRATTDIETELLDFYPQFRDDVLAGAIYIHQPQPDSFYEFVPQ